ncbi:MAG: alanine:cation symporter family protein [Lachnospiraceae bacterium]|nr:alanine:cation symporter family protein [Lachnospiraceae bacterium]
METVVRINDAVNSLVWGTFGMPLLLGAGLICTLVTGAFQFSHLKSWCKGTFGSIRKEGRIVNDAGALSQFRTFCMALMSTVGTGNIAGVSTAICVGGPGAVFWMWIAAVLGMATKFSENVLGVYFRRRNSDGAWSGGPMYYLRDGVGSFRNCKGLGRALAVAFCIFTVLASFGIGNMGQINKITLNTRATFLKDMDFGTFLGLPAVNWWIGGALTLAGAIILTGGFRRLAYVAEWLIPFMTILYVLGCLIVVLIHITTLPAIFASIFRFALGQDALKGGIAGTAVQVALNTIRSGCKRGVFSNEAGLGSSVMAHVNTCAREPVKQGMWGIAEVFVDTIVICTMTALVVLGSGAIDLTTGLVAEGVDDVTLVATAFGKCLGRPGEVFVVLIIALFAFSTVMGWSYYGGKAVEYLGGIYWSKVYRSVFVLLIMGGALMDSTLVWDVSDTFNGLMMIPNLIGVLALMPLVLKLTRNYADRRIRGKDVKPMLSYDSGLQKEAANALKKGLE